MKAQAKATLRRAEAAAKQSEAEAAATRERASAEAKRADAEAKRADAEAAAAQARASAEAKLADADAAAARARSLLLQLRFLVVPALAVALAADWFTHESPEYIKQRMMAQLRTCQVPTTAQLRSTTKGALLPVKQDPFVLGSLPVMLLAPTGAGKSTLLASTARGVAAPPGGTRVPAPTVLVHLRHSPSVDVEPLDAAPNAQPRTAAEEAYAHLDATATQIYAQIGFPLRRAVLRQVLDSAVIVFETPVVKTEFKAKVVRDRTVTALRTLFEACEALCHERVAAGMSLEEAASVLVFDEVQDLMRDDRMARAGGRFVFRTLATLLVTYCVDRGAVRAAVAGSSALLSDAFDATVAAGFRWSYYELRDPERGVVQDALRARGYTAAEADAMVALCGTRLRLLQEPLAVGAEALGAEAFCAAARATAHAQYVKLLASASEAERRVLVGVLDAALRFWDGVATRDELPPTLGGALTPKLAEAAGKVLYVRRDRSATFQSTLHAHTWRQERKALLQLQGDTGRRHA